MKTRSEIANALKISAINEQFYKEHRDKIVEYIAEHDDAILEKYLAEHELTPEELRASVRRSTIALKLVPVVAGSAFKNKGVQSLLDAVVDYLPSPLDVPPVEGQAPGSEEPLLRRASDDQPFSALAFKIMSDPYVGHVTYVRVYSGVLKTGSYVFNSSKNSRERIGRLLRMHANKREDIDAIHAGDIAACVGLKSVSTGDTLCDEDKPVVLESIEFPTPVISVAIEPKTKADQDKLGNALAKLSQEDPTFKVHSDPDTGQTLISGMGEPAPGNHRGPHDARVRRAGRGGPSAGGLSRDDSQQSRCGRALHPAERWPRTVRTLPHRNSSAAEFGARGHARVVHR